MYNQMTMIGNCVRDIELRYSAGGSPIAKTAIATSHKYKINGEAREETMFIDVTMFGKIAEIANTYLRKGAKVFMTGRLVQENWTDKEGQKRSKHSVTIDEFKMLDSKPKEDGYKPPEPQYEQHPQYQKPAPVKMPENNFPEIDMDSEEIPF